MKRDKGEIRRAPAVRAQILRTEVGPLEAGKGPFGIECTGEPGRDSSPRRAQLMLTFIF